MSSYLVSPTGDDGTGDGSFAAPFKTIAHAASVAAGSPVDAIEIDGTVTETVAITDTSGFQILRGRGYAVSGVAVNVSPSWISVDSSTGPRLLVIGLTITSLVATELFKGTASDTTGGGVTIARCRLALIAGAVGIALSGPDPQTFLPALTMDLLHSVVEGPVGDHAGAAFANVGAPIAASAARNCIFRRLKGTNLEGTQPFDSDANVYFDDERDLTLGAYGPDDLRSVDPELVDLTLDPLVGSPVISAGVDLSHGYGQPIRTPPPDVGLGFDGAAPTIGSVDVITSGARTFVTPTDTHAILLALSTEAQRRRDDLAQIRADRSMARASGAELSRRFGTLYGVPAFTADVETYRTALEEISTAMLQGAPTWHAMRRAAQVLFGRTKPLQRVDFNKRHHFKVGTRLKIVTNGTAPSFAFHLTAGEILLEDRWIKVRRADFGVAHATAVHTLYVDGSNPVDVNGEAIVAISTSVIPDESPVALSGLLTFRRGETAVISTVDWAADVQPHRRLAIGSFASDYVIASVDDARHLTLREPFPEEDHVGVGFVVVPNRIFGTVTIDATGGLTRIDCPGRVGRSLRPRTHASKGFGYALTLDTSGTALAGAEAIVVALFDILGRSHPIHKLGFFKLRDDDLSLVLAQPWPFGTQSIADYVEYFDDPAWSTA